MKTSIILSVAILVLVFGLYILTGLSCGDTKQPDTKHNDKTKHQPKADTIKDDNKVEKTVVEKTKVEFASEKGKEFLVAQYGKGWGKDFKQRYLGIDGLVIGALLSKPNPLKPTDTIVAETLDYLLAKQNSIDGKWENPQGGLAVYETSTIILALKKALELDPNLANKDKIKEAIKRGVDYLILAQVDENPAFEGDVIAKEGDTGFVAAHRGGWIYGHHKPGKSPANLSTSHFAMEALFESGLKDDPKVKDAFKKAIGFLEYCQNRGEKVIEIPAGIGDREKADKIKYSTDGGGIYGPGIAKPKYIEKDGFKIPKSYASMTYALLKGYIFAGMPKTDPRVVAAFEWLKIAENFTFERNAGFEEQPYTGLYYLIYTASKALKIMGEDIIADSKGQEHEWRKEVNDKILKMQNDDGSWVNEKEPRWDEGNPVLATSYALLTFGNTAKEAYESD
ncbi:MAG: hypothetical protein K8S87_06850 [Planctomycetes bacterium]|nr:hypothetical protein [Planctomycetota bacterium]